MGSASLLMVLASRAASQRIEEPAHAHGRPDWLLRPLLPAFLAYIGFGLGYIVYMTFIIAWLKALGASAADSAAVWILLGFSTLLASLVWSRPLARWSNGRAMAAILAVLGLGALLPVVPVSAAWQSLTMQCSAALFGLGMFSVPSAISALIRQSLDKPAWGAAMATFTIAFAASQVLAPVLGGWITDWSGSLREGIAISAAVILASALVALLQKTPPPPATQGQG
jgi:MFS family permease